MRIVCMRIFLQSRRNRATKMVLNRIKAPARGVEPDYDVIIAGGGMAGTIVAHSIAKHSGQRLRVLVVDRSSERTPGIKSASGWTCGDAVSKEAVDYMSAHTGVKWSEPEIEHKVKGVMAFSPDRKTAIPFDGDGYMLNRQILPREQNNRAQKMGIEFDFGVNLTGLMYDGTNVCGVEGRTKPSGLYKKTARVVVDTTGMTSMLRNQIRNTDKMERKINRRDVESTGRHIMYFDKAADDKTEFDVDYCIIHLDQDIAPGGYGWVFPKGENKVNIGLGVEKTHLEKRNARMGRNDNVSILINEYVARNRAIKNTRLSTDPEDADNATGNFQVSVRRQNDCLVAGGYIIVGDSAWMPKPLDAGGIGPALIAGSIAGKCITEAIESGDTSESKLWKYNKEYIDEYGYKTAGLEVFRRFIQTLTNDQIDYGMKHFLGNMDVESISRGEHPDFGNIGKLGMLVSGILNTKLANGLRTTSKQNKKITAHYREFPSTPDGFADWRQELHKILDGAGMAMAPYSN